MGDDRTTYRKEAALLFNLYFLLRDADMFPGWDYPLILSNLAVAFDPSLGQEIFEYSETQNPSSTLLNSLDRIERLITSRCGGILEFGDTFNDDQLIRMQEEGKLLLPRHYASIEILHRSAEEFLVDSGFLEHDTTSSIQRKMRVVQAVFFQEYLQKDNQGYYGGFSPLQLLKSFDLPVAEQRQILNLMQEVYNRKVWPMVYEVAAANGFYELCNRMLPAELKGSHAVQNYLWVYLSTTDGPPHHTTMANILEAGADPNSIVYEPVTLGSESETDTTIVRFLAPAFTCCFDQTARAVLRWAGDHDSDVRRLLRCIYAGVDFGRRFLSLYGSEQWGRDTFLESRYRPFHRVQFCVLGRQIYDMNGAFYFQTFVRDSVLDDSKTIEVQRELWSLFNLRSIKPYCRPLITFTDGLAYELIECPSTTPNAYLDWRRGDLEITHWDPDQGFKNHRVRYLAGAEVPNVAEWLVQRGYVLGDESDLDGVSGRTPFKEMVEIYDRIDKKYRSKELVPPEYS